ncbi:MAG: helix-turn-helix transcriptional regulator [Ignavibacteriae bacterium]|nr:helix-turn-helix transcriptional regulator [Ignavibacteriota bacterium]
MSEHPTQETLSRKEREKRARQQDILKAARELIATKGFRDTTLDEIAQKAEFGKGTLYNYFASKEDIFHAIIDQAIEIRSPRRVSVRPGPATSAQDSRRMPGQACSTSATTGSFSTRSSSNSTVAESPTLRV